MRAKRFQIPVNLDEELLIQKAAKKMGKPAAEWARDLLSEIAKKVLNQSGNSRKAAEALIRLNGPTDEIEEIIKSSTKGKTQDDLY